MPDNKTHIDYTFQDIQRYLNNGMSGEEMRALEKAALNDPFLSDAIDGFAVLSGDTANKHINQIQAALHGKHQATKVVSLSTKKFSWWRIAAMIVLVAGAGALSIYISNNNSFDKQKDLAANNNVKEKTAIDAIVQDSPAFKNPDTILIAQNNIAAVEKKKVFPKMITIKQNRQDDLKEMESPTFAFSQNDSLNIERPGIIYRPEIVVADAIDYKKADSIKDALHLEKALQGRVSGLYANKSNNQLFNYFNGQIADNNNAPVPNAVIIAGKNQATVTDKNGFFNIAAPDSVLQVMVSSAGFNSVNTSLSTNSRNIITLLPASENLSEVVVTGYGTKARKKTAIADSAYPVGGWQSFLQYMDTTLNRETDSLEAGNNLDLEDSDYVVEFLIDANGNPYSFRIPKNINPIMRSKIIEMIKDGPRWVPAPKNNKAKLKILH